MLRRLPALLRGSGRVIARNLPKYQLFSATAIPAVWASHCFNQQQQQNRTVVTQHDILANKDIAKGDNIVYHSEVESTNCIPHHRHPHDMKMATGVLDDDDDNDNIPETVVFHKKPHSTYQLANDIICDDKFDPDHVPKVYPLGDEELEKEAAIVEKAKGHRSSSDVILEEMSNEERMMMSSMNQLEKDEQQPHEDLGGSKKKTRATGPDIAKDIPEMKVTKHVDPTMRKGQKGPRVAKDTI